MVMRGLYPTTPAEVLFPVAAQVYIIVRDHWVKTAEIAHVNFFELTLTMVLGRTQVATSHTLATIGKTAPQVCCAAAEISLNIFPKKFFH